MPSDIIYNGKIYSHTNNLIESTENELLILSPWFGFEGHIKDALVGILNKGVKVIIVTRKPDSSVHAGAIKYLERYGASIFYNELLHAKILLSDRSLAIIGSANLQEKAMQKNHEIALITNEYEYISQILDFISNLQNLMSITILSSSGDKFKGFISKAFDRFFGKKDQEDLLEDKCPNCGGTLVERKSDYGIFYGCSNYPSCRYKRNI